MTGQEIRDLFKNNNATGATPPATLIASIGKYATVDFEIGNNGIDYYYLIDVAELAKADVPKEILNEILENGWSLSKDRKKFKKFAKSLAHSKIIQYICREFENKDMLSCRSATKT